MPFHIQPIREFLVRPALPSTLSRMTELAYNILWSWEPVIRAAVPPARPGFVAGMRIQSGADAGPRLASGPATRAPPTRATWRSTATPATTYDARIRKSAPAGRRQADRLLLRRVRPHRMPAGLFRRPGRALGRPSEIVQRSGLSAGRRRPALSAGLLPPVSESRRLAAGALSRSTTSTRCRSCR